MTKQPEIPDYEIGALLGRGGMASVYRARHTRLNRTVALKIMHPELAVRDQQFGERFLREARIAADLNHPLLVQVYDVNKFNNLPYIAMEYVPGGDLAQRLKSYISPQALLNIIEQVAAGLDYAHAKGYVHRDIKPANILFRNSGEAVIADFGISKALHANTDLTALGSVLGTPTYMSPEQASGKPVDGRSDFYSVAVMAYQILIGTPPFCGNSAISVAIKHVNETVPVLPAPLQSLQTFIDMGLAKQPDQRFSTGLELTESLRSAVNGLESAELIASETLFKTNLAAAALASCDDSSLPGPSSNNHYDGLYSYDRSSSDSSNTSTDADADADADADVTDTSTSGNTTITIQMPAKIGQALLLIGLLALVGIGALWMTPSRISQTQQSRVDILINAAQADIRADRFVEPAGGNAMEKYVQALAVAPEHPEVTLAIEQLAERLLIRSKKATAKQDWPSAKRYALQAMELFPESEAGELQLAAIRSAKQSVSLRIEVRVLAARSAIAASQWGLAVENYSSLTELAPLTDDILQEIVDFGEQLLATAKSQSEQKAYHTSNENLVMAKQLLPLIERQQFLAQIKQITLDNQRQQRAHDLLGDAGKARTPEKSLHIYLQALKLSPNSSKATQGLQRSASSLLTSAQTDIKSGNPNSARTKLVALEQPYVKKRLTSPQRLQVKVLRNALGESGAQSSGQQQMANFLNSSNSQAFRRGAKQLYKSYTNDRVLLQVAEARLTRDYTHANADKNLIDGLSWLCSSLGKTGDGRYKPLLVKVSQKASSRKLKKYARKAVLKL